MAEFVNRVSQYPVVDDTYKAASEAYKRVKAKESLLPILEKLESAAVSLASLVKPVVESNIAHKVDDVACHQFLDRFESLCPTLKESSAEELLGPVANRALTLAETCADYCLPEDKVIHHSTETPDQISRAERLSRIKARATDQAMSMFHSSVARAHGLLSGLYESGVHLTQIIPTTTIGSTLTQAAYILMFACNTAKAMGVPIIYQGLTTAKEQTEKLNSQLKESSTLNWLDLQNIILGLDKLRTLIAEQPGTTNLEMQPLPTSNTEEQCVPKKSFGSSSEGAN